MGLTRESVLTGIREKFLLKETNQDDFVFECLKCHEMIVIKRDISKELFNITMGAHLVNDEKSR